MKKNKGNVLLISQIIPLEYSGAGVASLRLGNQFNNNGILFKIITATKKDFALDGYSLKGFENELSSLEDKICRFNFIDYQTGSFRIFKLIYNLILTFFQFIFFIIFNKGSYKNVYVSSCTVFTFFPVVVSKFLGKKIIIETTLLGQDDANSNFNNGISFLKLIRRIHFLLANNIVDVSPALHRSSSATVAARKSCLIPFGVDTVKFYRLNEKERYNLKSSILPFAGDRKVVLFVGGISNRKGFDIFLNVVKKCIDNSLNEQYYFVVIGSRNYNEEERHNYCLLQELNETLSLKNKVFFSDPIGIVNQFMQVSDIFLFPTYAEGLPIVIIEAMTCGCIPVLSKVEGISDYLVDERSGYIIDSYQANEYYELLVNLVSKDIVYWVNASEYTALRALKMFSAEVTFNERVRLLK